jgi:hypothetical protein
MTNHALPTRIGHWNLVIGHFRRAVVVNFC